MMSDMTRITATRDAEAAEQLALKWKDSMRYNVAIIRGTDSIRLSDGTEPPKVWESGEDEDWTIVIATKKNIILP